MAFVLSLFYIAVSLLSPSVLPEAIWSLHVNIILGVATILAMLPRIGQAKLGALQDSYLVFGLLIATALSCIPYGFRSIPGEVGIYLPIFIVFYFVLLAARSLLRLKILVYMLFALALFILVQGAIADRAHDVTSPYLVAERTADGIVSRYKGLGVLGDPNDLAQMFATLIPMLFIRWKKGSYFGNILFTLVPAAVLVVGMYFTHSRGGAIALLALCLFGFKDKLGITLSSILGGLLFVGMMALNVSGGRGMNEDDGGRVAAWGTGLQLFVRHPIIGVGIDHFPDFNPTGHTAHNSYILCIAEVGLIGYFCWMGTIVSNLTGLGLIYRSGQRGKKETSEDRQMRALPPHVTWLPPIEQPNLQAAALAAPGIASAPYQASISPSWSPPSVRFGSAPVHGPQKADADLVQAARFLRIAFVGLLTSAFFLSRTFSMLFYLVLGMSAAVRMLYLERHSEAKTDLKVWLKRVLIVLLGSIVFLYLFVRIRGVR